MKDLTVPFPPPSEQSPPSSSTAPVAAPPLPLRSSSVQYSTPYVPPSLQTPEATKSRQMPIPHTQQIVFSSRQAGGMAEASQMAGDPALMQQPLADKKPTRTFQWQSLNVFS